MRSKGLSATCGKSCFSPGIGPVSPQKKITGFQLRIYQQGYNQERVLLALLQ